MNSSFHPVLLNHNVVKNFEQLGNMEDLCTVALRQLSPEFNQMLNYTTFWNTVGNTMSLEIRAFDWTVQVFDGSLRKFVNAITKSNNWQPEMAYIFRKVIVQSKLDGLNIKELLATLSLHTTTFELAHELSPTFGKPSYKYNCKLTQFMNQFRNLEHFEITGICRRRGIFDIPNANSTNELGILLDSLSTKPKVTIHVAGKYEEILAKFSTKPNIELVLYFSGNFDIVFPNFYNHSNGFGHLKNIKTNIEIWNWNWPEMKIIIVSNLQNLIYMNFYQN